MQALLVYIEGHANIIVVFAAVRVKFVRMLIATYEVCAVLGTRWANRF
jgi:hypothetical protein